MRTNRLIGPPDVRGHFAAAANARLSELFLYADKRIVWAHDQFSNGLVMTSSFGVQSVIMLELMKKTGLKIPVVSVDIAGPRYDTQRSYRAKLQQYYGFDLHLSLASGDDQKVAAMEKGLEAMHAIAWVDGIRASQTENRAGKSLYDPQPNGFIHIHPILDWNDDRADYFIRLLPPEVIHPDWKPGARSTGGRLLAESEKKPECGLHTQDFSI